MASPTSKDDQLCAWPGRVLRHDAFAEALGARRETLDQPEMPRNAGNRRTPSKRAMLQALKDLDAKW